MIVVALLAAACGSATTEPTVDQTFTGIYHLASITDRDLALPIVAGTQPGGGVQLVLVAGTLEFDGAQVAQRLSYENRTAAGALISTSPTLSVFTFKRDGERAVLFFSTFGDTAGVVTRTADGGALVTLRVLSINNLFSLYRYRR